MQRRHLPLAGIAASLRASSPRVSTASQLSLLMMLQVANPHGKLIYTTREKTEDKFSFKARYAGRYAFCLTLSAHNSLSVSLRSTHRCAAWSGQATPCEPLYAPAWQRLSPLGCNCAALVCGPQAPVC